jgi:hypothetical protein
MVDVQIRDISGFSVSALLHCRRIGQCFGVQIYMSLDESLRRICNQA